MQTKHANASIRIVAKSGTPPRVVENLDESEMAGGNPPKGRLSVLSHRRPDPRGLEPFRAAVRPHPHLFYNRLEWYHRSAAASALAEVKPHMKPGMK